MRSISSALSEISFFRELDPVEIERLAAITLSQTLARKSNIFMEGEERKAVFYICRGIIKVYKIDRDGNEQIVNFLKEGELFPHTGFFDQAPYPATAEVMETAELLVIPISAFERVMIENPTIAIKVMRVMGGKIRELQSKLQDFAVHDVNRRIIATLLRLAKEHGEQSGRSIAILLPLTHLDVAKMAGTTRETVNRLFNQLKKDHILAIERKMIVILDPAALQTFLNQ